MSILYILIITILLLIILLFTVASKIIVHFNSAVSNFNVTLLWLYPMLKSVVSSENDSLMLSIYLFDKRIFKKQLKMNEKKMKSRNLFTKINPTDIHVSAQYGFKDPYITGLIYGASNMILSFFTLESLYQKPNFFTNDDFINVYATARLNLGRLLLKLV